MLIVKRCRLEACRGADWSCRDLMPPISFRCLFRFSCVDVFEYAKVVSVCCSGKWCEERITDEVEVLETRDRRMGDAAPRAVTTAPSAALAGGDWRAQCSFSFL